MMLSLCSSRLMFKLTAVAEATPNNIKLLRKRTTAKAKEKEKETNIVFFMDPAKCYTFCSFVSVLVGSLTGPESLMQAEVKHQGNRKRSAITESVMSCLQGKFIPEQDGGQI